MVATVDGFDLAYTGRGSWKAYRSYRGKIIDEIPVAWTRDRTEGKPPLLIIWFEDESEAGKLLESGKRFVAATSVKKEGGRERKRHNSAVFSRTNRNSPTD